MSCKRRKRAQEEAFQMAPMIDMVFLLLVFFMTVSTLAKDARPEMELAISAIAVVPLESRLPETVSVFSGTDGPVYFWGARSLELADLEQGLQDLAADGRLTGVLLRGPHDLPWRDWGPVWTLCKQLGIDEVSFSTFEH